MKYCIVLWNRFKTSWWKSRPAYGFLERNTKASPICLRNLWKIQNIAHGFCFSINSTSGLTFLTIPELPSADAHAEPDTGFALTSWCTFQKNRKHAKIKVKKNHKNCFLTTVIKFCLQAVCHNINGRKMQINAGKCCTVPVEGYINRETEASRRFL